MPVNMMVTNVPGPQFPLYLMGAKLIASYPAVPLMEHTGLGVALMSYDGKLFWGFNADYDLLSDLRAFVESIERAFAALARAAGVELEGTAHEAAPPARAASVRRGAASKARSGHGASSSRKPRKKPTRSGATP